MEEVLFFVLNFWDDIYFGIEEIYIYTGEERWILLISLKFVYLDELFGSSIISKEENIPQILFSQT